MEFRLDCGSKVEVASLLIEPTYANIFSEAPEPYWNYAWMTPRVLKRVHERVAEHWGERPIHLIEPFCTQARRGPKLPPWFVAVWLMRKQFGINLDGRDSELVVVWFGNAIGEIPLYDAIFRQIRSLGWDELAVKIGELDPEIIGVSGDLKTDGRVGVTFQPKSD